MVVMVPVLGALLCVELLSALVQLHYCCPPTQNYHLCEQESETCVKLSTKSKQHRYLGNFGSLFRF